MCEYDEDTENDSATDEDGDVSDKNDESTTATPETSLSKKIDDDSTAADSSDVTTATTAGACASVVTVDGFEIKQEKLDEDDATGHEESIEKDTSTAVSEASASATNTSKSETDKTTSPKKTFKTSLYGKTMKQRSQQLLNAKLKVKLPHAAGFKSLKKAKLHAQQQHDKRLDGKSLVTSRGRPPKDDAKAVARQKLMRQLNAIKTSVKAGDTNSKRRGRPPGSKNKVKRVSRLTALPSPLRDTGAVTDSSKSAGTVVAPAESMQALKLPITPVTKRAGAGGAAAGASGGFLRRQSSQQNGHYSSDSAHSPGSAHSSLMSPQQMSPAQLQRRTPEQSARDPYVFACGQLSPVLSELEIKAFWRPPEQDKALLDNVIITDVKSNDTTVTIRECSTSQGFFKNP